MQQSHSLDFKLVQRVCLLQQALDQALGSLDELKAQVKDKQWVEAQLANTEKYANVQQQAIAHLKQQLAQFAEVQNDLLNVMGYRLNHLIDHQQHDFGHLHVHFQQSYSELQTYLQYLGKQQQISSTVDPDSEAHHLALQAEVMIARSMAVHLSKHLSLAKQHLDTLRSELGNHHLNVSHILKTIQSMIADLENFDRPESERRTVGPEPVGTLKDMARLNPEEIMTTLGDDEPDLSVLEALVERQEGRIQELETVLREQVEYGTQIRQRYQAIAAERDYYKQELAKLQRAQSPAVSPSQEAEEETGTTDPNAPSLPTPPPVPRRYRGRSHPSQPIKPLKLSDDSA
jgi:DNA repair exonuclease SbcCD ATPase subunit